jgi:F0F1-type ATP synthase membrane subunit a
MFFVGANLIGLKKHGLRFFSLFLPNGVPMLIIPFLVIIEVISYFSRVFSLAIRIFANMMSGHILLKILIGLM